MLARRADEVISGYFEPPSAASLSSGGLGRRPNCNDGATKPAGKRGRELGDELLIQGTMIGTTHVGPRWLLPFGPRHCPLLGNAEPPRDLPARSGRAVRRLRRRGRDWSLRVGSRPLPCSMGLCSRWGSRFWEGSSGTCTGGRSSLGRIWHSSSAITFPRSPFPIPRARCFTREAWRKWDGALSLFSGATGGDPSARRSWVSSISFTGKSPRPESVGCPGRC